LNNTEEDEDYEFTDDQITERERWWKVNGQVWAERLRDVMVTHRNIGHN
jgi:hypothetical protein